MTPSALGTNLSKSSGASCKITVPAAMCWFAIATMPRPSVCTTSNGCPVTAAGACAMPGRSATATAATALPRTRLPPARLPRQPRPALACERCDATATAAAAAAAWLHLSVANNAPPARLDPAIFR
eukprot:CAMPEP_0115749256 /NCGR_PEP_ID=MMETSP0272-20121206/94091_1 /TAXON_ID=71861 /ORGANISM="Scrippsiella trochoidea, Strain CCMP3099" /LENGTH=125 /DNA_ID=CAMNT_0003194287 /DNA_START=848 /DNA_END=1222 /DNA_ORIENTATION=-